MYDAVKNKTIPIEFYPSAKVQGQNFPWIQRQTITYIQKTVDNFFTECPMEFRWFSIQ